MLDSELGKSTAAPEFDDDLGIDEVDYSFGAIVFLLAAVVLLVFVLVSAVVCTWEWIFALTCRWW